MTTRLLLPLVLLLVGCDKTPPSCPQDAPSAAPTPSYDPDAIRPSMSADVEQERRKQETDRTIKEAKALIEVLNSCPRRKTPLPVSEPEPKTNPDPSRDAPKYLPENIRESCPKCTGFGGTVMAITPSRKSAEEHALALRSLMAYYNGVEWNRHVTIIPWFGDKFALIFADTYTKPANELCAWLDRLGWAERYASGIPGRRACQVYERWPPEKP